MGEGLFNSQITKICFHWVFYLAGTFKKIDRRRLAAATAYFDNAIRFHVRQLLAG